MSRAATSVLAWGIYLVLLGPVMMIEPNVLLRPVGVPETTEVWIRMLGMLLFLLAVYYILAVRAELTPLFRWSVWVRAAVLPILVLFTVAGLAPPIILAIGFIDLSGAIWTAVALRFPKPGDPRTGSYALESRSTRSTHNDPHHPARSMLWYDRSVDHLARTRIGAWIVVHLFTPLDRRLMRWSKGRLNMGIGTHLGQQVLLTTSGRKSGKERAVSVVYTLVGEDLVVVASRGGHAKNPGWYHNLKVHPVCRAAYGGREMVCTAREAKGAERDRLWAEARAAHGVYADYAARTERRIPVMVLTPTAPKAHRCA
jgi:deazaflavin-dependent oxidoreductase (nitroreductase family)